VCSETNLKGTTLLSDSEIAQKSRWYVRKRGREEGCFPPQDGEE
jgi:hypothetical protein